MWYSVFMEKWLKLHGYNKYNCVIIGPLFAIHNLRKRYTCNSSVYFKELRGRSNFTIILHTSLKDDFENNQYSKIVMFFSGITLIEKEW